MGEFNKYLDIKLKFIEVVFQNYQEKLKEINLNYQIISNLKNEINFKVPYLNFNSYESLLEKVEKSFNFFEENKRFINIIFL